MKTILLPLKLDQHAISLFQYAEPIAADLDATLMILHVIAKQTYDNGTFAPSTPIHQKLVQEAKMILEHLSRKALCHGVRTRIRIVDGSVEATILESVKIHRPEMIIMGPAQGTSDGLVSRIMMKASAPVLAWQANSPAPIMLQKVEKVVLAPALMEEENLVAA